MGKCIKDKSYKVGRHSGCCATCIFIWSKFHLQFLEILEVRCLIKFRDAPLNRSECFYSIQLRLTSLLHMNHFGF